MSPTRVRIFYPADPMGVVPGGVDTFLRGMIKWAPRDIEFDLVGMTTAPQLRPPGRWSTCHAGDRAFGFFPVVTVDDAGGRGRVPLSLRYTLGTLRHLEALRSGFDVFDFHRPEPSLLFLEDSRPKNAYFHNDPQVIRLSESDNLWKRLPAVYELIERRAMARFDSIWCVRDSGVKALQKRYPDKRNMIRFVPTWVDADVFYPVGDAVRAALRRRLAETHRLDESAQWIISVGRLDTQKDPGLLFAAFARLCEERRRVAWLVVGDGVLKLELQRLVAEAGLGDRVAFLGLRPPADIADLLRAADVFALSSAYEGMPMALLEALGCGLPAAVTDVGEVRRVLEPGVNGAIAAGRDPEAFALALAAVLEHAHAWRGAPALAAVAPFRPADVLAPAYERYREFGRDAVALRRGTGPLSGEAVQRARRPVVGVPIDLLDRSGVSRQLVAWAKARESRYMCFVNVHSAVHATLDERHRLVLLRADLAAPDGAPIAWTLRVKGHRAQQRVDGPGMMWRLCADAEAEGVRIGLYGSTPETLEALRAELSSAFPKLAISYAHSPPFRELTEAEDQQVCDAVAAASVGLLFVGLGCPKQEYWMARHRGRIPAVMLGVGAAFEFHAGTVSRAPHWMREHGLEWLYRLASQPRRLWRRYLFSNSLFLAKLAREAARSVADRLRPPGG
jgi:exopolysaccharide biosynthesis WecB/TagA/CpsF family protein